MTSSSNTVHGPNAWQPYREPLRVTLARTVTIAVLVGALLARRMGGWAHWPMASLLVLWISLGGHFIELWFLNWLRPRLPVARAVQAGARLAVWFVGGIVLFAGMRVTAMAFGGFRPARWPPWPLAGLGFVGVELAVHLVLWLLGRPSFYNGRRQRLTAGSVLHE